jgi:hypothetical protein
MGQHADTAGQTQQQKSSQRPDDAASQPAFDDIVD